MDEKVRLVSPPAAVTVAIDVKAVGTAGVTELDAAEYAESPIELVAFT